MKILIKIDTINPDSILFCFYKDNINESIKNIKLDLAIKSNKETVEIFDVILDNINDQWRVEVEKTNGEIISELMEAYKHLIENEIKTIKDDIKDLEVKNKSNVNQF